MITETFFSDRSARKIFYEKEIVKEIPRLLSSMDRCPVSSTRGCLDREYWAWATKDFANMDMQRGLWILTYAYRTPFKENDYCGKREIFDWIVGGVDFWIKNQNPRGAFNHLYLNENSWMAAAFTLIDMVETYKLIIDEIDSNLKTRWLEAMIKAGIYLVKYDELHGYISNHRAGAAAALLGLFHISKMEIFHKRARELMDDVYNNRSKEGWFLEYDGPDPGYQTLDTHYQALFFSYSSDDKRILKVLSESIRFLSYFIHPDSGIGGEYGSRSCPHFFPGGFEVFAKYIPLSENIARAGTLGLYMNTASGLADSDTRNSVPLATSYILAHRALSEHGDYKASILPFECEFERYFPEAGLLVRSDKFHYTIVSASKGGVIKVFDKTRKEPVFSSCGYTVEFQNNKFGTTQLWTEKPDVECTDDTGDKDKEPENLSAFSVKAPFYYFKPERIMTPYRFLFFRIFNLTVGKIRAVNDFVRKHIIIGRYLKSRIPIKAELKRTLTFDNSSIIIEDNLTFNDSGTIIDLREHGFFSVVYMASARYFRKQDYIQSRSSENLAPQLQNGNLSRKIEVKSGFGRL